MPVRTDQRLRLRAARRSLSGTEQKAAAQKLLCRLARLPEIRKAQRVACYLAADGEIDLGPFIRWAWLNAKHIYLPQVKACHVLQFARYQRATKLSANRFGINEPIESLLSACANTMDIIIAPMVAYNDKGHRLGMGGGYYDRALGALFAKRPCIIGAAHECQYQPSIITAAWDVAMDLVATDKRIIRPLSTV